MEKVIIVGVKLDEVENDIFNDELEELENLAIACDMEVVEKVTQNLPYINKATYVGSGKVEEIKTAIDAVDALKEKGIDVPKDVSVTGADNIKIGEYFSPSLTTIDNMNAALGVCAFDELFRLIKGGKADDVVINSKIIERQSCILNL